MLCMHPATPSLVPFRADDLHPWRLSALCELIMVCHSGAGQGVLSMFIHSGRTGAAQVVRLPRIRSLTESHSIL